MSPPDPSEPLATVIAAQAAGAAIYYVLLVLVFRLAGKRLAGQTTTFDLIVLIGLGVALQNAALRPGRVTALTFVVTVFVMHVLFSQLCARSWKARALLRGLPRPLVENGKVSERALIDERLTLDELLAGLRKAGFESPADVRIAILEETGHISAVGR